MELTLTYDHRIVDGAPTAEFLMEIRTNLERIPL
jgi:pyruvate/2-oxoglutarate dehydrogenase complex dihydrolipoamide acyltransferase (E2) component